VTGNPIRPEAEKRRIRHDALDRAAHAQDRMVDANSTLLAVHRQLSLHPRNQQLLDQLDEANAHALACIEEMRSALQQYRDAT
jgi:hypothetical protein